MMNLNGISFEKSRPDAYSAFNIQILIKNCVTLKFTLLINEEEHDAVLLEFKPKCEPKDSTDTNLYND